MSLPRRHHFVPQMLQRRFTDAAGRLCVYDKRRPEAGVFATTPGNAFVQKDLNAIELKDGSKHVGLEIWYSELEGEVAPIIDKIVERARARKVPGLTDDERIVWDNFIYHQQKRAPDVFERLGLVQDFEKDLPARVSEYEREERPLTDEERAEIFSPAAIERMIQHASVQARGRGSDEVVATLAALGIAVAIIISPKKSFILGDHPLARMGPTGELGHPATELWMPIAPDVAVSPWGQPKKEKLIGIEGDHVRRVNETIYKHSNIVAARSEALIRSLAGL